MVVRLIQARVSLAEVRGSRRPEKKPIMRLNRGQANLPTKDRQLVTEHENRRLLRALTSAKEHQLQRARWRTG